MKSVITTAIGAEEPRYQRGEMIRNRLVVRIIVVAALWLAGAPGPAVADAPPPGDPMTVIKTGVYQVMAVFNDRELALNERREKLRSMSARYFDFENMAKSTLGYHWRELTPAQREEFVPLFTDFIQDAYLSKMQQTTIEKVQQEAKTARIQFTRQTYFGSDYAEVFSSVSLRDQKDPLQVNYLMHQTDGRWRVYDVTVESISLIANYRNQFNRIINNQGFNALISELRAKREQLRQYINEEARNSRPR
jgi:phospholipid transport system substrate-binding protein